MINDTISINGQIFPALIAVTEAEHVKGLMGQPYPTPIMVFPYSTASVRKFWMKNTIAPLDIIFCSKGKIIEIISGEPLSTQLVGPNTPSDCVVELPGGSARQYGLKAGDYIGYAPNQKVIASLICSKG